MALASGLDPFVVDIGCGDGRMLSELDRRGIRCRGFDISESFVQAARARGVVADLGDAKSLDVPPATLVIALGEVLAYQDSAGEVALEHVIGSAAENLVPGGALVFDVTSPEMKESAGRFDGDNWVATSQTRIVDRAHMERRIVVFCRDGDTWRRVDEVHRLRLFESKTVERLLCESGLAVKHESSLGDTPVPPGRHAYLATKPE